LARFETILQPAAVLSRT